MHVYKGYKMVHVPNTSVSWFYKSKEHPILKSDIDNQKGFGGEWVSVWLSLDSFVKLKGPWVSNPLALFEATGVDLR
jgi:hypothetical protein